MENKFQQEINQIDIPEELHKRSQKGILQAKAEMTIHRKRYKWPGIIVAASLILSIGILALFNQLFSPNTSSSTPNGPVVNNDGSIDLPMIQLPEDSISSANIIGLIVYNGKIYTQTRTEINPEDAKRLLGEKLGTTKGNIDEWSSQEAYDNEFASSIGKVDVYVVKGYDRDFRIMAYDEARKNDPLYATFYENLNGITVNKGEDVFGKLNMIGNVIKAEYRTFSDWNNSIYNYQSIKDMDVLNSFIEHLNESKPLPRTRDSDPIGDARNNEAFRELTIHLEDGARVKLILLKGGYIYYGHMSVYFQMDEAEFSLMWEQLQ